jgi:hypothetical protein
VTSISRDHLFCSAFDVTGVIAYTSWDLIVNNVEDMYSVSSAVSVGSAPKIILGHLGSVISYVRMVLTFEDRVRHEWWQPWHQATHRYHCESSSELEH